MKPDHEREVDVVTDNADADARDEAVDDTLEDSETSQRDESDQRDDSDQHDDEAPASESPQVVRRRRRWIRVSRLSLVVGAIVVILDQITKHWALNALGDGREVSVVWTLQWNLSFNTGMAFSRGEGLGPVIGLLAVLIVIVLVVSSAHVESRAARFAAGLLIGGALGNLVDRIFRGDGWLHGAVVDFIDFQWFPIFNVADMGVTCGAILFALASMREGARADAAARARQDASA